VFPSPGMTAVLFSASISMFIARRRVGTRGVGQ
jgi:hypothetical protein